MTRQRYDKHGTEYGEWTRKQPEIDSKLGYVSTNIDYLWENYKTGDWMLIEEKRFMAQSSWSQKQQFERLVEKIEKLKDNKFHGFHCLKFEKTNPEDGKMYWDGIEIRRSELLSILQFKTIL